MAAPATLPALLDTLTKSLNSTLEAAPKLANADHPKDSISLLDVKNELLLSYLQNLVFLILLKLRQARNANSDSTKDKDEETNLDDLVVKKLVELRLYLEKGVRPLEDKLRYQIDKVLRAADDAERSAKAEEAAAKANEESESEEESGDEGDNEEGAAVNSQAKFKEHQHRPDFSQFARPAGAAADGKEKDKSGVYRPPRIAPTVMPMLDKREKKEKPLKSATLDEYIQDEMSTAPVAQPSIGTTIVQHGRRMKTATERRIEDERRNYEESNFVRLPKESKKDLAKKGLTQRGNRMNFGGEEWRDLGEGVDRINKLTKSKSSSTGTKALLEKSRKRGRDTTDGPRGGGGEGVAMGERFQKRLKVLEGGRRDRGKKK